MRRLLLTLLVLVLVSSPMALPRPSLAQDDGAETRTIMQVLAARANDADSSEYDTLVSLLQTADSDVFEALSDPNTTYTLFAPTNAAFDALSRRIDPQVFGQIVSEAPLLTGVLLYHLLPQYYSPDDINSFVADTSLVTLPTSFGQYVDVALNENGQLTIDGIVFTATPIPAANGVIYQLDFVLLPEVATLDQVLLPYINDPEIEIFDTLLLSALQAADPAFEEELADLEQQITFFVPTDDAFYNMVLDGSFSDLLSDNVAISSTLRYHILDERFGSFELLAAIEAAGGTLTLDSREGPALTFVLQPDGTIRINDSATIIDFDIDAINGTVHVIDGVLTLP